MEVGDDVDAWGWSIGERGGGADSAERAREKARVWASAGPAQEEVRGKGERALLARLANWPAGPHEGRGGGWLQPGLAGQKKREGEQEWNEGFLSFSFFFYFKATLKPFQKQFESF